MGDRQQTGSPAAKHHDRLAPRSAVAIASPYDKAKALMFAREGDLRRYQLGRATLLNPMSPKDGETKDAGAADTSEANKRCPLGIQVFIEPSSFSG